MKILIATTNASELAPGHPTGTWLEEFAVPYLAFRAAGAEVTVASPKGGATPIDPASRVDATREATWAEAIDALEHTHVLASVPTGEFDALFIPGGHGPMIDLAIDPAMRAILTAFDADGKIIGAVCHGPAAFINAMRANGDAFVAGRRLSGFTNAEETIAGLERVVPFLLETVLEERGAHFDADLIPFASHVVRDGNLITGQNPASSTAIADLMLEALHETGEGSTRNVTSLAVRPKWRGHIASPSHRAATPHLSAAAHFRHAADFSERAADRYSHGSHEEAAHFALLAHAHMQHAGTFMSDAAKIHAELHGGSRRTVIG